MILDEKLAARLRQQHEQRLANGELLPPTKLQGYYDTFHRRFGPEVLRNLDGEALLTTMHEHGNRDSLVYWLEFKNDDEFPTLSFGSIAGGSALKFGIYRRAETGAWMIGHPTDQKEISVEKAIEVARRNRDQLIAGVELLDKLPTGGDDTQYARLQSDLDRLAPDVGNTAWGHKYFSLLYPDKLDDYHNPAYQRFHLIRLLQTPPSGDGRYLCAGRYAAIVAELGFSMNNLTKILNGLAPAPYRYWRVATSGIDAPGNRWDMVRDSASVAVGWPALGDLSAIEHSRQGKAQVRKLVERHYSGQAAGKITQQVFNFVTSVAKGDLILASDGATFLGIGRVSGPYTYHPGSDFPHRRPLGWISLGEWTASHPEGLGTTLHEMKEYANLVEVERRVLHPQLPPPEQQDTPKRKPEPVPQAPQLSGVPGRIQAVLDRKRQVILYGPPGTGKTYWARRTALDLAAYAALGLAFDQLDADQQATVLGQDGSHEPLVRVSTFHPAYGYEDFIEGYRPTLTDGQLAFERRAGIFKKLCDDATNQPTRRFYLIIDEINRGDIPRIFGELLTILERDKRGQAVLLPLSGEAFSVPDNVYVIGTMNTADRSIALLDTALRRRFGFIELMPDKSVLGSAVIEGIPLGSWLYALNQRIREHIGRDARNLQVGHAYLLDNGRPVSDLPRLARVVQDDILPLLEEYCYEDYDRLKKILGPSLVDVTNQRIKHELFEPANAPNLAAALLDPFPELATFIAATSAEAEELADEIDQVGDGDDADDSSEK
jgi:5-methylcytosine-specific restriction protein B